jgi:putative SOS response-associated peptidase YedK
MCGRYNLEFDEEFYSRYRLANKLPVKPNYNVAPSQIMPVVVSHSPNTMEFMIWGMIPFW